MIWLMNMSSDTTGMQSVPRFFFATFKLQVEKKIEGDP